LARAYTKKDKIIKFACCYHGHQDSLLLAAVSGLATLSLPRSAGVPKAAVQNTLIAAYNNMDSVNTLLEQHNDIAGAIIEPVCGNMGVVMPQDGFLKQLKDTLSAHNALLIADEVMTGFRPKFGGAQDHFNVEADITCLGKVIGGGMPVGAYGARNAIMETVAPLGPMYQAGTLSGSPIATACGLATLTELQSQNPYNYFEEIAEAIETILLKAAKVNDIPLVVNRFGSMINPFFTTKENVVDYEDAKSCDTEAFAMFFWEMMREGVFLPPSQFEAWFLNTALKTKHLKQIEKAAHKAMRKVTEGVTSAQAGVS